MDFPATRWTLVSQLNDPAQVDAALDQLCQAYWEPIYAYLFQSGRSHAETQDLTQEFLGMVLRQHLLERADPAARQLRSWLLAALRHFLANARRHGLRQKRGAGATVLPFDHADVLPELKNALAPGLTPDEAFDRAWLAVLLRRVLEIMSQQYQDAARSDELQALLPWLVDHDPGSQAEAAAAAGMSVATFRVRLHRLRGRYRETLRREIASTLEREEDYPQELAYLFRINGQRV